MSDTPALPSGATMRRMKRSRTLTVGGLMAATSFTLTACDTPQVAPPPPIEPALAYQSLAECKAADAITDAECDAAEANARRIAAETAPRFASRADCEAQWGAGQCEERVGGNGGSFFAPFLTGFVIGQLLDGGRYRGGGALYRDRDGNYQNGYGGGYLARDFRTGRQVVNVREHGADVARQAPTRVQSRTTVVSRGGFGGGGRGFGG